MAFLDKKIPPPVIALASLAIVWGIARLFPTLSFSSQYLLPTASLIAAAGFLLALWGIVTFRRAGTTLNPHTPENTDMIVRNGPFRFTRNPMYLGLAIGLAAACIFFGNPLSVIGLAAFVAYMTQFQIKAEERAIEKKFGTPYVEYRSSVRRWL
ncbi:MAG: isoprenylcysteine carboxylmethyltransferase family protein [Chloracidobacterium sp.]|nr:isoprenylcysteine carboxylmethyltransferase family protein [Chloracidobacterium sp.]MCO5334236.1 isoprenylcysteine carboxylmethyltransferase family protein [Pyrinomonadaceae bacterium]